MPRHLINEIRTVNLGPNSFQTSAALRCAAPLISKRSFLHILLRRNDEGVASRQIEYRLSLYSEVPGFGTTVTVAVPELLRRKKSLTPGTPRTASFT